MRRLGFEPLEDRRLLAASSLYGGSGAGAPDQSGPRIAQVLVGSTSWDAAFRAQLADSGLGTIDGYAIPSGPGQAAPLPWASLDQIVVEFDRDVDVQQSDLVVVAVSAPLYSFSAFSYSPSTRKAVWTLSQPIGNEKLTLFLDGSSASAVRDLNRNSLDGTWTDYASAYPSGDGGAGTNFSFRINVLRGDYNDDNVVDISDVQPVAANYLQGTESTVFVDGTGDGIVDISEVQLVAANWLATNTADTQPPAAPQFALSPESASGAPDTTELPQVTLEGNTSPNVAVRLLETGATTLSSDTGLFQFPDVAVALGDTALTAQALDGAGNTSLYRLTIHRNSPDTQPPEILLDNASGGVSKQNVTLTGHVLDDFSGVASLEVQIDQETFVPVAFGNNGQFSIATQFALDGSADGQHALRLRATDGRGNVSGLTEFSFVLDTLAPTILSVDPSDGATVSRLLRDINIAFSEPMDEGTVNAQTFVLTGPNGAVEPVNVQFDAAGQSVQLTYPQLAQGAYQLTVHTALVTDRAGNPGGTAEAVSSFTVPPADIFETIQPALRLDASNPQNVVREGAVELTTGKYLTAADAPLLRPTDELTILLRVNQTTLGLDRNFVTKWTYGGQGSYALSTGLHANQQKELTFWTATPSGGIGVWAVTNGANLQANTSYEVALIYDGKLAPADRVRFLIDGRAVPVTIENGTLPATLSPSNAPLNVGKWGGSFDRFMDGAIESLAIYNKALADADVAALQAAAPQYPQLAPEAKDGLAAWWDFEEASGDRIDAHNGIALAEPTGVARRALVLSFADPAHGVDLTQGYAKRPQYVENSPMNNRGAILFDGVNDALVQQISDVLTSEVGDAYLVVRFPTDAVLQYDTFFSIASYESEKKYMFFSLDTINPALDPTSDGKPHFRLRWRDGDVWNTDIRGAGVVERDKTYLLHFWGNGPGLGWGMEVNGIDQRPFAKTGNATFVDGSWFGYLTDENNMTVGDFERSDGAQGFARFYLGEILAFASKLSSEEEALVEQYLATKWGVTMGE